MPPGYGYKYVPTDYWWINYMVHNLTAQPYKVSITYDVDIIPTKDAPPGGMKDVHPIWMDVQNGSIYPVFDVLKGSGTNGTLTYPDQATDPYGGGKPKNEWTVPQAGVLVHTFGHLHPGGLHVDLDLLRDGKDAHVFESKAKYYEPAGAVSWDVSMTATRDNWAVAVQPGDVLKISATYDTTRASWYESMGLAVVWMYDGPGGVDPFVTKVDQPGVLTHGHLPENNNHGGKKTTLKDPRTVASGAPTSAVDISNFLYGVSDLTARKPIPTVTQGQSITFDNLDARRPVRVALDHRVQGAVHRDHRRRVPARRFQHLVRLRPARNAGAPTVGHETWSTPADLPPGTYTYFCRVHPFMRGAFRVVSVNLHHELASSNQRMAGLLTPVGELGSVRGWTTSGRWVNG